MKLFDTHAHYNDEKFEKDVYELLNNMSKNNIEGIVIPGWNVESSIKGIELANKYENVYCAVRNSPK